MSPLGTGIMAATAWGKALENVQTCTFTSVTAQSTVVLVRISEACSHMSGVCVCAFENELTSSLMFCESVYSDMPKWFEMKPIKV